MIKDKKSLYASVIIVIVGVMLNLTYRKYIYSNNLNDFNIANTIGSLICVPASALFFKSLTVVKYSFKKIIIIFFIINIIYEFIGITGIHGTFDYFDLLAICLGTCVIYLYNILFVNENK